MPRRAIDYDTRTRFNRHNTTDELIDIMEEESEIGEYREALEAMTAKTKEQCEHIRELLRTEMETLLETRYALGEAFQEMYQDETQNGAKVYGRHAIQSICKVLDLEDGFVRTCMKFVQTFSREDLKRLRSQLLPRGSSLSWSHLHALFVIEDDDQRNALLQKTLADGLTSTELAYEVKKMHGRSDDQRGRPLKMPTGFDQAVQQLTQVVESWEKRFIRVFNDPPHTLLTKAAELSPDQITDERLCATRTLAHRLQTMAQQVSIVADKAYKAACRLERELANGKVA